MLRKHGKIISASIVISECKVSSFQAAGPCRQVRQFVLVRGRCAADQDRIRACDCGRECGARVRFGIQDYPGECFDRDEVVLSDC